MRKRVIKSVYDDQDELLAAMVGLHSGGTVECDPTFGRGLFYRYMLEVPRFRFDIAPRRRGVVAADVRWLPLRDAAVGSVMFDPPFLDGAFTARRRLTGTMASKYSSVPGQVKDLIAFYGESIAEIYRVLKPGGIFYFKCQDIVDGRRNAFVHVNVHHIAVEVGFEVRDLFILLAKSRPIQHNLYKQVHARKYHCYFWVFKKPHRPRAAAAIGAY